MLAHINKRVKSRTAVQLPMTKLTEQYTSPETAEFVSVNTEHTNVLSELIYVMFVFCSFFWVEFYDDLFETWIQANARVTEGRRHDKTTDSSSTEIHCSPDQVS